MKTESEITEATYAAVAVRAEARSATKRARLVAPLLAALLSAALTLPCYPIKPEAGTERDMPALIIPSLSELYSVYPWLGMMDRRLLLFGYLALFCALTALLLFPILVAGGVNRALHETSNQTEEKAFRNRVLSTSIQAAWRPWLKGTLGLLLIGVLVNLALIGFKVAPEFPAYPYKFGWAQNLAMTLPALLSLPLYGLLLCVLSAAAGVAMRRPAPAILFAYLLALVGSVLVSLVSRDIPYTVKSFLNPVWGLFSAPEIGIAWLAYGVLSGLIAGLVWYFLSPSARKTREG